MHYILDHLASCKEKRWPPGDKLMVKGEENLIRGTRYIGTSDSQFSFIMGREILVDTRRRQ